MGSVPQSPLYEGRFGRMFRRLPAAPTYDDAVLQQIAESMRDSSSPSGGWGGVVEDLDNPDIPSAYTYFGQFIDHDITFDPMSDLQKLNDPDALVDFRTPRLDLDSVYGSGPDDDPFQYDESKPGYFLIGPNDRGEVDLPRNAQGIALIGDPRNDENVIVSQLHLTFLKLHNKFMDHVTSTSTLDGKARFLEAQRLTRWTYQFVVIHDYLRRIVGDELVERLLTFDKKKSEWDIKRKFYLPRERAYMPVEFSVAAFRFGHSMIRGIYNLSGHVTDRPIFVSTDTVGELDDLRGRRPLPAQWTIEWDKFLTIGGSAPQPSRKIDARLVEALFVLPRGGGSLALRNLQRGQALGLPSGQDVARAMGAPVLSAGDLAPAPDPTPLWFYILKESESAVGGSGTRLGPTGGRIVAEVLLGLLETDSQSFFRQDPNWLPAMIGAADPAKVQLADLVTFATTP